MSGAVPEQYRHLVQTIIAKLIVRNATVQNHTKTHVLADTEEATHERLSNSIAHVSNKVNMSKYEVLNGMYLKDRYIATQRLLRFALVCVVFTSIVIYLGIHNFVPPVVAGLLCMAWWGVLLAVAMVAMRTYLSRDKLFWNKYVWADPPMNAVSLASS